MNKTNWLAILVSAISAMGLGFFMVRSIISKNVDEGKWNHYGR